MESKWRFNVGDIGLADRSTWLYAPDIVPFLLVTLAPELTTPFVFAGHTYTHILLGTTPDGTRLWNYAGLLADGRWWTIFFWSPAPRGFPYGADVIAD